MPSCSHYLIGCFGRKWKSSPARCLSLTRAYRVNRPPNCFSRTATHSWGKFQSACEGQCPGKIFPPSQCDFSVADMCFSKLRCQYRTLTFMFQVLCTHISYFFNDGYQPCRREERRHAGPETSQVDHHRRAV